MEATAAILDFIKKSPQAYNYFFNMGRHGDSPPPHLLP